MSFQQGSRGQKFRAGRLRPRSWQTATTTAAENESPPTIPCGPAIDSFDVTSLLVEETEPKIDNVKYVASYNWQDGERPVILVPGSLPPPILSQALSWRTYNE